MSQTIFGGYFLAPHIILKIPAPHCLRSVLLARNYILISKAPTETRQKLAIHDNMRTGSGQEEDTWRANPPTI
jgi:hypothetical protein